VVLESQYSAGRSTAVRENWQWKPAVAYCRYADDFVLIVKGTKAQAEAIRVFRWRLPEGNPYLRTEARNTYTSRFTEVAMAFASV